MVVIVNTVNSTVKIGTTYYHVTELPTKYFVLLSAYDQKLVTKLIDIWKSDF